MDKRWTINQELACFKEIRPTDFKSFKRLTIYLTNKKSAKLRVLDCQIFQRLTIKVNMPQGFKLAPGYCQDLER
jgi:hypothetical protein